MIGCGRWGKAQSASSHAHMTACLHVDMSAHWFAFVIERINVVSRRGRLGIMHGLGVDIRRIIGDLDGIGQRLGRAVAEYDDIISHRDGIVREMAMVRVMLADLLHQGPEDSEGAV